MAQLLRVNNDYNLPNIGIGSGQAPPPTPSIYIGNQPARYTPPPPPSVAHPTWGAPTPAPSRAQPAFHVLGGLLSPITASAKLAGNDASLIAARATGNKVARIHARKAGQNNLKTLKQVPQAIARGAAQLDQTLFNQPTFTPKTNLQKAVFGSEPTHSLESQYSTDRQQHSALNSLLRVAASGALDVAGLTPAKIPLKATGKVVKSVNDIPKNEAGFAKLPGESRFQKNAKNAYKVVSDQKPSAPIQPKGNFPPVNYTQEVHNNLLSKKNAQDVASRQYIDKLGHIKTLSNPTAIIPKSPRDVRFLEQGVQQGALGKVSLKPKPGEGQSYINTAYIIKNPKKISGELNAKSGVSAPGSQTTPVKNYPLNSSSGADGNSIVPPKGVKVNPGASGAVPSASLIPKTARSASQSRKLSPRPELPSPTGGIAPPKLPGSRIAAGSLEPRQPGLPQTPAGRQLTQNPSPNGTPTRGFVQSVNKSLEVSPEVRARTSGTYSVRSTAKLAEKADQFASGNLGQAVERVSHALATKPGSIADKDVANAIAVAKRLDANKNHAQATDIYESLSEHLTKQGQSIQAASLLSNRTPEGLRYQIAKTFKKAGVNPSEELNRRIDDSIKTIKATKPGTVERTLAVKQLQKMVADNIPSNLSDKAIAFWKAGLLSGMRTQSGNILSNETFSVLHNASNPLAALLDKGIGLRTGQRTKALTGRGLIGGTGQGIKQGAKFLKSGIDERSPLTNKFETRQVNFKNKALNTYVNGIFKLMGAADRPHYYRQLRNSLNDLAIASGKTQGLSGEALRAHIAEFTSNPPTAAFQVATNEAEKAVLANDTILSKAVANLRQAAESAESPLGKAITEASINLIMPFTKVPSAFISRVIDFTPVGAIKTISGQISRGHFDQRALVTAISEATTGTGLMYLGKKLADSNLLAGNYPNDPKEQQRWKADGKQANAVKVGNSWISLNYFGPVGLLFGMGGRISTAEKNGGGFTSQQIQAYSGLPKDLTGQSFLQGLNSGLQAVNEPGRYAQNFINSQTGSIVPTLSNDIATATDSKQRVINSPKDAIKSRIPVLRESLNPAQDVYGNPLNRKTSPLGSLINPFRPSNILSSPVKAEVDRLHNADPNNTDLSVTPTLIAKSIQVEGKPVKLIDQQRYDLQKKVGQTIQTNWGKLIQTSQYKAMSDVDKAKALSNLRTDSTTLAERQYVTSNNLGTYNKPPSKAVQALGENGGLSKYIAPKTAPKIPGTPSGAPKIPKATTTVYNAKTNTWTQTNANTGKVTQIASDGSRTVIDKGLGSISGANPNYVTAIRSTAPKYGVETRAALAVAAAEGLSGAVGDGGTSYGPFQLHIGGALPAGKDQAWAESPAGIEYALQQISSVAKGKTGADAIASIVNGFEKPANAPDEIARALAVYNGTSAKLASSSGGSSGTPRRSSGSRRIAGTTTKTKLAKAKTYSAPKIPKLATIKTPSVKGIKVRQHKAYKSAKIAKIPTGTNVKIPHTLRRRKLA